MIVRPNPAEPELTYVLLTGPEASLLADALRKPEKKLPAKAKTLAHDLRIALREVARVR